MMHDWFKPPTKIKPGWPYRVALMVVATWVGLYLLVGPDAFGVGGMIAMGILVVQFVIFLVLLNLLDPVLRAKLHARLSGRRGGER